MSVISRMERDPEKLLSLITSAREKKALAPEGWYDGDELRSERYTAMLDLVVESEPQALFEMIGIVASDPRFDVYLDDETGLDVGNQIEAQLREQYGAQFDVADLFIVLSGLSYEPKP